MLAIGIDLIEVDRIKRSIENYGQRFLDRVFTEGEQRYCKGRPESFAARFAAKEAVGKALGTGIGDISWQEIEVVNEENGRPLLRLHGRAHQIASDKGLDNWQISLSHTKAQAIGMVVALRDSERI